ncbi:MAG: nitrile hydratase accessory protein, partial [Chloroflexi bacterium]|nr:nitrile hydratase accessory protein [Chloroflexota bacterium]
MDRLTGPLPELDGPAAPPRKNGELVFQAPWEGRVFSMALALQGAGAYQWREFSDGLAREIATAGRQAPG